MPAPTATAQKILLHAQRLLQERGFRSLSFQELADAVKIRKASVYHHFKTKDDLAHAMVQEYRSEFEKWSAKISATPRSARDELAAYFDMFRDISKDGRRVCPGGALSLNIHDFSSAVQKEVAALVETHQRWLSEVLERAGATATQARAEALVVAASVQGALQIIRNRDDAGATLQRLFKQLDAFLFNDRK